MAAPTEQGAGRAHAGRRRTLSRYLPVLGWLPTYSPAWLTRDLLAGLTVWAMLIPEGMALARVAGLPATAVFYAAPWALLAYFVFGPSGRLVVAVSGAAAALSAATVADVVARTGADHAAATAALAILAGVASIAFGLLRLSFVSSFLSRPVAIGYTFGLGATIAMWQLPALLGVPAGAGDFVARTVDLVRRLPDANSPTTWLGVGSLALLFAVRRVEPRIPAAMVALLAATAAAGALGLAARGVAMVGDVPVGILPPVLPAVSGDVVAALLPGALGLALVVYAEALGAADRVAGRHGGRVQPNQELIGLGSASAAAGLFRGFPVGVSLTQSTANDDAGGRTQLAGGVAAGLTLVTPLVFATGFARIPEAVLAAIVVFAIRGMFDLGALDRLRLFRTDEFALAVGALIAVLVLDVLAGLVVAVALSLLALAFRASRPRVTVLARAPGDSRFVDRDRVRDAKPVPGVLIARIEGSLWYANAQYLVDRVLDLASSNAEACPTIVLDIEETRQLDMASMERLEQLGRRSQAEQRTLILAGVRWRIEEQLVESGLASSMMSFATIDGAVDAVTHSRPGPSR